MMVYNDDLVAGLLLLAMLLALALLAGVAVAWTQVGLLTGRADDAAPVTPGTAAVPPADDTPLPYSSWVKRWYRPGDEMLNGTAVPSGEVGVLLLGDVEIWDTPEELGWLGDALAARFASPRVRAVLEMGEVYDNISIGVGRGFAGLQCGEADVLATALGRFGLLDAADNIVAEHCLNDDAGDEHGYLHNIFDEDGIEECVEAARVYVLRLLGIPAQPGDADAKAAELARLTAKAAEAGDDVHDEVTDRIIQLRRELGDDLATIENETGVLLA